MKLYLDTCSLQRPLDDKSQLRVQLEAEAILAVLNLCINDEISLVSSEVLEFELGKNPHPQRKAYVAEILETAEVFIEVDRHITLRAQELERSGFKGVDALHIACAEAEKVDYFCSCDDRLLKRAHITESITIKIVSPFELVEEITR
ncbi:MAG: PIN domain-containing protein [Chloroflexi bacterium]|nr:PIN domain-containing protein [Chloroflexota bacterium]